MDTLKLQDDLIRDEGIRLQPYKDSVGKLTIGIGRNLIDKGITRDEAVMLCQNDIQEIVKTLSRQSFWKAIRDDDVRCRAIVNMAFNLGCTGLFNFRGTLFLIEAQNWEAAASRLESSLWSKQVGDRAKRIIHMIRTGSDPT